MNTMIITVSSITYAMKVKKRLERSGIKSTLIKVDMTKTEKGCNYGIKFQANFFYDVISILKQLGINYSVYSGNDIS